jgi:hypothetical protein
MRRFRGAFFLTQAPDATTPAITITGGDTVRPSIALGGAANAADWDKTAAITLDLTVTYDGEDNAASPKTLTLTSNGWRPAADLKIATTGFAPEINLSAGADSVTFTGFAFGSGADTSILADAAGVTYEWSVESKYADAVTVKAGATATAHNPTFELEDPLAWEDGDKFKVSAVMTYEGVEVPTGDIEVTVKAEWSDTLPVALTAGNAPAGFDPANPAAPKWVFTPTADPAGIIANLGAITWQAPGGFTQARPADAGWEYDWKANDGLTVTPSGADKLAAGSKVTLADVGDFPAGDYYIKLGIAATKSGMNPAENATGVLPLHSDGWVGVKVETLGGMEVTLAKATVAVGPAETLSISKIENKGSWLTDFTEAYLTKTGPDAVTVTWTPGSGVTTGTTGQTIDATELAAGKIKLNGAFDTDWDATDEVPLSLKLGYHSVDVELADAVTLAVVEAFGKDSATRLLPATSTQAAPGISDPGKIVLTPDKDGGKKAVSVTNWASGTALGKADGTTAGVTNGAYEWSVLPATGLTLGHPASPAWALDGVTFTDGKLQDYVITLKITSDETTAAGNSTGTITVRSDGWAQSNVGSGPGKITAAFLGTTGSLSTIMEETPSDIAVTIDAAGLGEAGSTDVGKDQYAAGNTGQLKIDWDLNTDESFITVAGTSQKGGGASTEWGEFTTVPASSDTTISWDGDGDWKKDDIAKFDALLTYDGVTLRIPAFLSVTVVAAEWSAMTPVALTLDDDDVVEEAFTPVAGGIYGDLGILSWTASSLTPAHFGDGTATNDVPTDADWTYAWAGYKWDAAAIPAAWVAEADLTAAPGNTLNVTGVSITDPTKYPAGKYSLALTITASGSGADTTVDNETARIEFYSDGWVPSEILSSGSGLEYGLATDQINITTIDGANTTTLTLNKMQVADDATWATSVTLATTGLDIAWSLGTSAIVSTGTATTSDVDTALLASDGKLKLSNPGNWRNGDVINVKATVTHNSVPMVIDDIEVTVVDPFGDGTTTKLTPLTSTADLDGDGTAAPFTFTPVATGGTFPVKPLLIDKWESGNAWAAYNTATGATTDNGKVTGASYALTGSDGANNLTFIKPTAVVDDPDGGGPGVPSYHPIPNFALAGVQYAAATPGDYTVTLKINSAQTTATGNITTFTVHSNGWGNPGITSAFLGTTKTVTEAAAKFSETTGPDSITVTIDTTVDSSALTDISLDTDFANDNTGDLKIFWSLNQTASTLNGELDNDTGTTGDSFGAVAGVGNTITWTTAGSWVATDTMVFDCEMKYDNVSITFPAYLEIEVDS